MAPSHVEKDQAPAAVLILVGSQMGLGREWISKLEYRAHAGQAGREAAHLLGVGQGSDEATLCCDSCDSSGFHRRSSHIRGGSHVCKQDRACWDLLG